MESRYRESPVFSVISDKYPKLQRSRQISGICAFPESSSQSYFWKNSFTISRLYSKSFPKSVPVNPSAFHQHFSVSVYSFPGHTLPQGNQPGIFYPGSSSGFHLHHFLPNTKWAVKKNPDRFSALHAPKTASDGAGADGASSFPHRRNLCTAEKNEVCPDTYPGLTKQSQISGSGRCPWQFQPDFSEGTFSSLLSG